MLFRSSVFSTELANVAETGEIPQMVIVCISACLAGAVCGGPAVIHHENDAEVLFCENPDCLAKKIKSLTLFVSRDAMNIDGLSEATIEKLLAKGMLHELSDLYHLSDYRDTIIRMEGFGEKSYDKLIAALEASRSTTLPKFIYSLGISNIGQIGRASCRERV